MWDAPRTSSGDRSECGCVLPTYYRHARQETTCGPQRWPRLYPGLRAMESGYQARCELSVETWDRSESSAVCCTDCPASTANVVLRPCPAEVAACVHCRDEM